ncbi:MFS transporter [Alteribacillus sp. JSM 102045]|uniref:MFS transporter n=1 Tax=Alteribacillus sp. JSM 102045 TaxID=1562101 RepID=UPI0035C238F9
MEKEIHPYKSHQPEFWKITIGLALASFINFANLYVVQPLLPIYAREFSVSPAVSSLTLSLTTLSLVSGLLVFGFLSDRIGRVKLIHLTLCLSVLPLFAIPLYDAFWWLTSWRFITGFVLAGLPAVAVAYINEEVSIESRGLAVCLYIASNAFGGMGGRFIGGYFADHFSWQTGFYYLAVLGLNTCFFCFYLIPASRFFHRYPRSFLQDVFGMAVHLKNPLLLFAFLFGMLLQTGFTGIWTYAPFYLEQDPFQLSIRVISLIYFTYLLGVAGSPVAGRLSDSFGVLRVMAVGLFIMIIGNLLTTIINVGIVVIGLSIICMGFFIAHSMASTWVGSTAKHHRSGATSLYLVIYYIGAATGGTAIGTVWSGFGWIGVITVSTILPIVSGITFFCVVRNTVNHQLIHMESKKKIEH